MDNQMINDQVSSLLAQYSGEHLSVVNFLCDRYATIPERVGLFYEKPTGDEQIFTFANLKDLSSRFAEVLKQLGVEKGDRVSVMLPKSPEMIIAALAVWRLGAVYVPLFTAFGPRAIEHRVLDSGSKIIITDDKNRNKLNQTDNPLPISVVTVMEKEEKVQEGDYSFWTELRNAKPVAQAVSVSGEDLLILLYTSGTTGNPKGVEIPVKSLASFEAYMRFGIDLREDDMYWNLADPGWAYGLYYNLIGPLLIGKATLFYSGPFDPAEIYRILQKYRVTNFAAAPTAYKGIINAGEDLAKSHKLFLRVASSAGEPLNPNIISWSEKVWGIPIYDHFGQTELGMAVNNHHLAELEDEIKPGSMGKSMPGFRMAIIDEDGNELGPNQEGQMAVDMQNSPLCWFRRYWNDDARTKERFTDDGRYYYVGDAASKDEEGYFFFSGRADDIILSAGYRIGPFEVESALMQHAAVAETAVVGKPDELRGEVVKAFIVLKPGYTASDELSNELSLFVKNRLSAHEYPKEIAFVEALPKTPSGKTQRFLLKQQN